MKQKEMKKYLDFGVQPTYDPVTGKYDDFCPAILEAEEMYPADHRYLLGLVNGISTLHNVSGSVSQYIKTGDRKIVDDVFDCLVQFHPYFSYYDGIHAISVINQEIVSLLREYQTDTDQIYGKYKQLALSWHGLFMEREVFDNYMDESFSGLSDVFAVCAEAHAGILLLLNDSIEQMRALTPEQRNTLFLTACPDADLDRTFLDIRFRIHLPATAAANHVGALFDFDEDRYNNIRDHIMSFANGGEPSDDVRSLLKDPSEKKELGSITYEIPDFATLIRLEFSLMLDEGIRVRKCLSCGRFFCVQENGQEYCNYTDRSSVSCFEEQKRKERKKEYRKIYQTAYKAHYARMLRGKMTSDEFEAWKAEYGSADTIRAVAEGRKDFDVMAVKMKR